MSGRPFARVYYVDLERDYPNIFRDPATLGTYVRLLALADSRWPIRPELPRSVRASCLRELRAAGLIASEPDMSYRIKGLDAERSARSTAASYAARTRHGTAERSADSDAPTMPTHATSPVRVREATSLSNPSTSRTRANGHIVDEREWTDEQRAAAYTETMTRRLGTTG